MDESEASITETLKRRLPMGATCEVKGKKLKGPSFVVRLPGGKVIGAGTSAKEACERAIKWYEESGVSPPSHLVTRSAGRPPGSKIKEEDQRKTRSVRLDELRWKKLQRLGSSWLENAIDRAKEPKTETTPDSQFKKAEL